MSHSNYTVSFIIPHKGRIDLLQKTVSSVFEMDFDCEQFEVLVVTQEPDLKESDVYVGPHDDNLSVLHRPKEDTISALRNFGVSQSDAPFIAFLDADVELSKNWLEAMMAELIKTNENRILVSAVQKDGLDAPPLERIRTVLSNASVDCDVQFLPGRNLFLRRESFDRIGGFPEHLVTCEDYFFTDKAHKLGRLFYSSTANYVHLGEDKRFGEMFKKEIWRAQSNLKSIKGRHIGLAEWPSFLLPFWLAFFFLLFVCLLLLSKVALAAGALLLFILPVAAYALRLYKKGRGSLSLQDVAAFYLVYFPARVIGTFVGLFKALKA